MLFGYDKCPAEAGDLSDRLEADGRGSESMTSGLSKVIKFSSEMALESACEELRVDREVVPEDIDS
jgi:hypothetical protein